MKSLNPKFIKLDSSSRLHHTTVPIIGLTGGIATGKSTAAGIFKKLGFSIINADELVKKIYSESDSINFIKNIVPSVVKDNVISFPDLRKVFFNDPAIKETIEKFIYSKLPRKFQEEVQSFPNSSLIIYDVPLLFEKNLQTLVDVSVLVYCPEEIQVERLVNRDQITRELAQKIIDQQMKIEEKKKKADFILNNSRSEKQLAEEINHFLRQVVI
jgi:dephospho-CoA kinase